MKSYKAALDLMWSKASAKGDLDIDEAASLADGWNSIDRNKKPVPEDIKAQLPNIKAFLHDYQKQQWANKESYTLMTNGLLSAVLENFGTSKKQDADKALTDKQKLKLGLYYGKIDLIQALQFAFGIATDAGFSDQSKPTEFASTFLFEFSKNQNEYFVTVMFNKKPITLSGACGDVTSCEYSKFTQYIQSIQYQGDITQVCISPKMPDSPSINGSSVSILTSLALAGGAFFMMKKKRQTGIV